MNLRSQINLFFFTKSQSLQFLPQEQHGPFFIVHSYLKICFYNIFNIRRLE